MRNFTKFLAILIFAFFLRANSLAQVSSTATASATIYTALTITHAGLTDLRFGNIIPGPGPGNGTVTVDPSTGTASYAGGTAFSAAPVATAAISAAQFTVAGTPGATYSINVPVGTVVLTGPSGATMNADNFSSDPTPTGALDATIGTQTLRVGARLTVTPTQAAGTYTSAAFTVTVQYN